MLRSLRCYNPHHLLLPPSPCHPPANFPAPQDTKFSYLWNCRAWLDQATKVVIATGELRCWCADHSVCGFTVS